MIDKNPLVVVKQPRISGPAVHVPRQFQHVVSAAAFRSRNTSFQLCRQKARLSKPSFAIAGATRHVSAACLDGVKEEVGDIVESDISRDFITPRSSDHLRNMSVHMQPAKL